MIFVLAIRRMKNQVPMNPFQLNEGSHPSSIRNGSRVSRIVIIIFFETEQAEKTDNLDDDADDADAGRSTSLITNGVGMGGFPFL